MTRWKAWFGVAPCPYCKRLLVFEMKGDKKLRGATKREKERYRLSSD